MSNNIIIPLAILIMLISTSCKSKALQTSNDHIAEYIDLGHQAWLNGLTKAAKEKIAF